MNINVKTPDGQLVSVQAEGSWTCAEFKKALAAKIGVAAEAQKLTVGGKIMKDAKTLNDFPAATSQTVSLVIAGAGAAKPASAGASGERQQAEGLINKVISIMKENTQAQALAEKYKGQVPPTGDLRAALGVDGEESAKKLLMAEGTKILEGDWTPFDQYHKPLRDYALKALGEGDVSDSKRQGWIETAAAKGVESLEKYPKVKEQMNKFAKPGRDMTKELMPAAKLCAKRALDLFLDGASPQFPEHPRFSDQFRLLLVTTVGAGLDTIIDTLDDGKPRCEQLMAELCGEVIKKLCTEMPEHSTLIALGGPMAANQVNLWHEEYVKSIKNKSFVPPKTK